MTFSKPPVDESLPAATYPHTAIANPAADDVTCLLTSWTDRFNQVLRTGEVSSLDELFFEESYWRDHLTFSWDCRTLKGPHLIAGFINTVRRSDGSIYGNIDLDVDRPANLKPQISRIDKFGKLHGAVAFLSVETLDGFGRGYIRLLQDSRDGKWKFFTLFTTLDEIKGHPERVRHARLNGQEQRRENDVRQDLNGNRESLARAEPAVLIVGAGQTGLSTSARLSQLGVSNLVIDQKACVGDGWRQRYHRLVLHDPVWYNHFPYMPFPESWPVFTPKDRLANWLEVYAQALDLNIWTSTTIQEATWAGDRWQVNLQTKNSDGTSELRVLRPCHIVQATGQAGKAKMPSIDGMHTFRGSRLCHSSEFTGVQEVNGNGRKVVVIGSGTSAHDIAEEFCLHDYDVTLVQRSPTCVDPTEYSKGKDLYTENGPRIEDADILTQSLPTALLKRHQIEATDKIYHDYNDFFEGLRQAGFHADKGPEGAGRKLKFLSQGGGYYIDVGASGLIINGRIKVHQSRSISRIEANGIVLSDGTKLVADQIIFATGFESMRDSARDIFGNCITDRVDRVWGLDAEGEMKSVWRPSGHPGFWFAAGNLAMSRYYSKLLALQIKAAEMGMLAV